MGTHQTSGLSHYINRYLLILCTASNLYWISANRCVSWNLLGTHSFPPFLKSSRKQSKVIKYIWMHGDTSDTRPVPLYHQVSTDPPCCLFLCPCTGNYVSNNCTYRSTMNRQPSRTNRELGDYDPYYYSFLMFGAAPKHAGSIHTPSVPGQIVS